MKKFFASLLIILLSICALSAKPMKKSYKQKPVSGEPVEMQEIWGWVMQSRFSEFDNDYPLTDVGFFAADVDCYEIGRASCRERV